MAEDDNEDDEGFVTVEDAGEVPGDRVVLQISLKEATKLESSSPSGADRMFESDEEEEDTEVQEQMKRRRTPRFRNK